MKNKAETGALANELGVSSASGKTTLADTGNLAWNEFRALVEQVEDYGMFVLDLNGHVTSWNRGAEKIKGYTYEQIVGQHFSKFYPDEDVAAGKPMRELEVALSTGHVTDEGWRVRADGSRFWAFVSITLLRDDSGTPRGFAKVTRDLTERRNAEQELQRSEERFRQLVEGVADYAIYMLSPDGDVATWNAGAEKIKGYLASAIIGRNFSVFFTAEDQAAGRPQAELGVAAQEGRFEEEGWRVRADGSRFWASVVVTALRDPSGSLIGFSKITRDLTARRLAEETARQLQEQNTARAIAEASEARARQERERFQLLSKQLDGILEGVVDGITVQDRRGKVIFANTAAARLTGLASREELLNSQSAAVAQRFELLDEHGNLFALSNLPGRRVLGGEPQASAVLHIRERATGHDWWSRIRANAVLGDDGLPEMAINIWHDVSQERRREEHERYLNDATAALSKSLNYQATLDTLADLLVPGFCDWCAIHLLDGDALKTATVAHADPRKKKLAQEFQEKYPPNPADTSGAWQVIRSGKPILHEQVPEEALLKNARDAEHLRLLKNAGMRSLLFVPIKVREEVLGTMSLVAAESGRRYDQRDLAVATELGRRVGAFIENALLYERAQLAAAKAETAAHDAAAAGRMKDEFLATVSHELRTPLNAILGWASVLRSRTDHTSHAKGIEVIFRNATAQSKIIEDILDVSRIITGKLRLEVGQIDLVTIVADAIEVVRPSAVARDITLGFRRPSEPALLVGDPARLQQVMWNLLSNAVKFNERGGRVDIGFEQHGSQLAVHVTDNGRGIDPAFLPHVFERFKQADSSTTRRFGGLGLGLAIVRHIVELHGGHVAATSAGIGQGTSFEIVLPIRATAPLANEASEGADLARTAEGEPRKATLEGVRVLVVDDEGDARDLLELVLTQVGAVVKTASSTAAAFALLSQFQPQVIVSDIGMPEEDGYAFMQRVRASGGPSARTPGIALSAYTRHEDKLKALGMGFSVHLGKPVNPDDLTASIAKLAAESPG